MIPALPKLLLDPVKSANVILEIIETEKSYVRGLVELSELYIIPTAVVITVVDPATGEMREESFIPEDERDVVFGNIVSRSFTSFPFWCDQLLTIGSLVGNDSRIPSRCLPSRTHHRR